MTEQAYHIPALLNESLEALQIRPDGVYVDATFGGGGHSRAILERLGPQGHLYAFDQDDEAVARAMTDPRFTIVYSNFRFLGNWLRFYGQPEVDGILADLGVSFHHFDDSSRGFSFRFDGPLDMRMNRQAPLIAAAVLATYPEERLAEIFTLYGELSRGRQLARAIVAEREAGREVATTEQLRAVASRFISPKREKKELAMVYQALRIEVNGEMKALEQFLTAALKALKPGGRLAIITYHSLEDRLVKNFMRTGNFAGRVEKDFFGVVNSPFKTIAKPLVPSEQEVERNPRSRSARLRVAQKL
ncbi:MAG: 16S rRNA (cytosine(1402)-N(4))-methyltransferase RsmH [Firmicutes bacterium]|nr:16S rRNA (cytosine(1402)-N(4))-methyltransferase RsmH [Bacillota bacterium]MCM1401070.1 16S rRNA (cytosine(1402)-N(4))-methyltransferase RsmH [Bacteroides sp.]MCM1476989.1 16S rRNA (cytosine(1402)-N(4))-methyltransferase RsmH [Bacteroides sp.]